MKWAPNPVYEKGSSKGPVIRKIIRDHWDKLREILLKNEDKLKHRCGRQRSEEIQCAPTVITCNVNVIDLRIRIQIPILNLEV